MCRAHQRRDGGRVALHVARIPTRQHAGGGHGAACQIQTNILWRPPLFAKTTLLGRFWMKLKMTTSRSRWQKRQEKVVINVHETTRAATVFAVESKFRGTSVATAFFPAPLRRPTPLCGEVRRAEPHLKRAPLAAACRSRHLSTGLRPLGLRLGRWVSENA